MVLHCDFHSPVLRRNTHINVILPTPGEVGQPLPQNLKVLYLLHGLHGDETSWLHFSNIERYAYDANIAVVIPGVGNSFYQNMAHGEDFFTYVTEELYTFVQALFPVSKKREDTFIAGLSMGGYGALLHGLQNPARYSAIGAFSPGIPDPGAPLDPHRVMREDLFQLTEDALRSNTTLPDLFLCIGDRDFLYQRVTKYHQAFAHRWNRSRYRYDDMPGYDHEFAIWDIEILAFLEWIHREDSYKKLGKNKV